MERKIKRRITGWLRARGHTQRWLAAELGVSPAYVAMILNGRRTPSLAIAQQLEQITGVTVITIDLSELCRRTGLDRRTIQKLITAAA